MGMDMDGVVKVGSWRLEKGSWKGDQGEEC